MTQTDLDPPAPRDRPHRRGVDAPPAALRVVVGLVAVAFVAPFGFLVVRNLQDAGGFLDAVADPRTLGPLFRTLVLATTVSAATTVVGTGAAWLVTRTDLPGRRTWRILLPLPLVIPSFIGAFAFVASFATGGLVEQLLSPFVSVRLPQVRGFVAAFMVLTLLTFPYVYLPVAARLQQLPPSQEEAARLLGRRPRAVFTSIVLPQVRPAILAGSLLVFLYNVSEFGAVQLLRYDTLTRAIYTTRTLDPTTSLALSFELGALALCVVMLERLTVRGPGQAVAQRSMRGLHVRLGRWRTMATGAILALVTLSLLAPVGVLVYWTVRGIVHDSARASALSANLGDLLGPAVSTARVSVEAAVLAVVVALPVSLLAVRYRDRTAGVATALVTAGFALPGLAIALAMVFWTVGTPIYQTELLLVMAYVVHFGAQSLRASDVAVASVPTRMEEAARSLGASRWRRLRTVDLPLMAPGLLAGGGLVLLSVMKELPATLLLAPTGFQTLATRAWAAMEDAYFADASVASLALVVLSGVLTWTLVIRRSDAL